MKKLYIKPETESCCVQPIVPLCGSGGDETEFGYSALDAKEKVSASLDGFLLS